MDNDNIEFYIQQPSTESVFEVFGNMIPSYVLPNTVIINEINITGREIRNVKVIEINIA